MASRFWVGNGGDWSDYTNHWSATSGGSPGASLPTSADSVYFDVNSFSSDSQIITNNSSDAYCLNMDWTGVTNSPTFTHNGTYLLYVHGSLTAISVMTWGIATIFSSTSTGNTIASNEVVFDSNVVFDGAGGEWTLTDDLTSESGITIVKGTLRTNDMSVNCIGFVINGSTNTRSVYFGNSTINLTGDFENDVSTGLTFDAGTSTIKLTGDSTVFKGGGQSYYTVVLLGTLITIEGSNIFSVLDFASGTFNFTAGTTQTFANFYGSGASGRLVAIQSTSAGNAFTLSKSSGTVQCNYWSIEDCAAIGGAIFIADYSYDLGGNTGWDIATKRITVADGHEHTQPMALGMGYVFDPSVDSGYGVDTASVVASLTASDTGSGLDGSSVLASISASDTGHGVDIGSVAKAFFLIDSHNILQPLGVFVLRDSREELLPGTRDNTDTVPGRHGEFDFGSELEARIMEFKVHINTTPETKTALKRTLAAYLNPLLGVKPLIDSRDLEKTYYVKYAGNIDLTNYVGALQFTIPFKASDPIIYGSFEQSQTGSGTITNDGTLECPVKITITGAVTNPSVVIGTHTLTYTGTLTSSDTLIIDTDALTCMLNGVNAIVNLTGLTPDVVLAVGDTTITVPASGTTTLTWNERFI